MYPTRTTSYSTKYLYDDDEAEIHLCMGVRVWVSICVRHCQLVSECVCVCVGEWPLEVQFSFGTPSLPCILVG